MGNATNAMKRSALIVGAIALISYVCIALPTRDEVVPEAATEPEGELIQPAVACMVEMLSPPSAEAELIACQGVHYWLSVPTVCTEDHKCGLILDIHGWTMTAALQEASDDVTKLGNQRDFITVRPEDGAILKDWSDAQWADLHKIEYFLKNVASVYSPVLDYTRIHVAGFSQGAFLTYMLLCRASDLICSIAPLGMNALGYMDKVGKKSITGGHNCWNHDDGSGNGPVLHRSIMHHQGKFDPLQSKDTFDATVKNIKNIYGLSDKEDISHGEDVQWDRYTKGSYTKGSIVFEAALYDNIGPNFPAAANPFPFPFPKGHCFPSTREAGQPQSMYNCEAGSYTWGHKVLKFFKANQCFNGPAYFALGSGHCVDSQNRRPPHCYSTSVATEGQCAQKCNDKAAAGCKAYEWGQQVGLTKYCQLIFPAGGASTPCPHGFILNHVGGGANTIIKTWHKTGGKCNLRKV